MIVLSVISLGIYFSSFIFPTFLTQDLACVCVLRCTFRKRISRSVLLLIVN